MTASEVDSEVGAMNIVTKNDLEYSHEQMDDLRLLEALLFASSEPLTERVLVERLGPQADLPALLEKLQANYLGRGVEVIRTNGRWSFRTSPDLAGRLKFEKIVPRTLSRAATETLAIVAYHQPVTRSEIEEIRGVIINRGTLNLLLEEGWIKPRGRRQTPGRPVTWGTTNTFLVHFGLESLDELPGIEELKAAGLLDARRGVSAYGARAEDSTLLFDTEESETAIGSMSNDSDTNP